MAMLLIALVFFTRLALEPIFLSYSCLEMYSKIFATAFSLFWCLLIHQSTCPASVVSQACLFITMLNKHLVLVQTSLAGNSCRRGPRHSFSINIVHIIHNECYNP